MFGKKHFLNFFVFLWHIAQQLEQIMQKKIKISLKKLLLIVINCLRPIPIDKLPILSGIQSAELCL